MRARIPLTILGPDGLPAAGATVAITDRDTGAAAIVYANEIGASTIAQPLETDARGRVPGWLDRAGYEALITGAGAPTLEAFEIGTARDGGVDLEWLAEELRDAIYPLGVPLPLLTETVPAGFALLDGGELARADAPRLSDLADAEDWATKYGAAANPVTHLKLPDFRGRALVGADRGAGRIAGLALGDAVGADGVALTVGHMPDHAHALGNPFEIEDAAVVPALRDSVAGDWAAGGEALSGGANFGITFPSGLGVDALRNLRKTGFVDGDPGGDDVSVVQPSAAVDWILRVA